MSITATTSDSILNLGGMLGGLLNSHSNATKQIAGLLAEAQNAVAANDWNEVQTIANGILLVQGASQSVMSMARNLAHASTTAVSSFASASGSAGGSSTLTLINISNQQLVLSEVNALTQQLNSENSSIWHHLFGMSNLMTTGKNVDYV